MKHVNISIFVPHIGCPKRCSFCDQRTITGEQLLPHAKDIKNAVESAKKSENYSPENTEIAFFGGSFTAINEKYRAELLDAAYLFVKKGIVKGIRISTRPDAISEEILDELKAKGVTAIELGAQSMDEEVLIANRRGHTADDVKIASKLIKEAGFELGLQMMTGLYKSTPEKDIKTARELIALSPDTVRIYPTVILEGTELGELYKSGKYDTYTLDETIDLVLELSEMFQKENINIIRIGLHAIETEKYLGGAWHPAFGELCESRKYLNKAKMLLKEKGKYNLFVSPKAVSKMIGQSKGNLAILYKLGFDCKVFADKNLKEMQIKAVKTEGN